MPYLSLLIMLPLCIGISCLIGYRYITPCWARQLGNLVVLFSLYAIYQIAQTMGVESGFYAEERYLWLPMWSVFYHVGVDALALGLILLTTLCLPYALWISADRVPQETAYIGLFLCLQGLMIGVFAALNALLFYVFWEMVLIPMFFIIGLWGGARRQQATLKFFLYTFLGSLCLLVCWVILYHHAVAAQAADPFAWTTWVSLPLTGEQQQWLFWPMLFAFAVKIPMVPVHTWLPDAHVEAPTAGSVILAAIMLKLGGFGLMRYVLPILPLAAYQQAYPVVILSLIAIVYIALVALVQKDMKKLIAYSSITHMGFVTLGLFLVPLLLAAEQPTLAVWAAQGSYIQMISHGFVSAALFMCVGMLYERLHTRRIEEWGGAAQAMPTLAAFMVFFALANCGVPGTSGFVGEFLVLMSSFAVHPYVTALAATVMISGAAYSLWLIKRVLFGEIQHAKIRALQDIGLRDRVLLGTLAVWTLFLGVYPQGILPYTQGAFESILQQIHTAITVQ